MGSRFFPGVILFMRIPLALSKYSSGIASYLFIGNRMGSGMYFTTDPSPLTELRRDKRDTENHGKSKETGGDLALFHSPVKFCDNPW